MFRRRKKEFSHEILRIDWTLSKNTNFSIINEQVDDENDESDKIKWN